jgi:hypothetical protein
MPWKDLCFEFLADIGQIKPDVNVGHLFHGNSVVVQILIREG